MVRVAAAQVACKPGDVAGNVALHEAMAARADDAGVDLLVFPELSLTGYESRPDVSRLARPADCPDLLRIAALAKRMTLAVGFIEANTTGKPFNSVAILSGGRVIAVHRKLNLPTYGELVEGEVYAAGEAIDFVQTPLGRTACLICADTWNPALPWLAALGGAEALMVPVASARGAVAAEFDSCDGWNVNLRHTAMSYGLPVVMANQCGTTGLPFWGGSMILDAFGRVIVQAGDAPDLLVAEIDPDETRTARERLPTIRDADPTRIAGILARMPASLGIRT